MLFTGVCDQSAVKSVPLILPHDLVEHEVVQNQRNSLGERLRTLTETRANTLTEKGCSVAVMLSSHQQQKQEFVQKSMQRLIQQLTQQSDQRQVLPHLCQLYQEIRYYVKVLLQPLR